jgi:hypothetical protein
MGASGVGGCGARALPKGWLPLALALALLVLLLAPACGSSQPQCTGGLHPYKNKCLSNTAIEYLGCTEGRGFSSTKEISGGLGGTFKVVANATLNLAYKKNQQEDTPVALQIVKDCMEIAKTSSSASDTEQSVAASYEQKAAAYIQQWQQQQVKQTPKLSLSSSSARVGEKVTVEGSNFWPNETVEIYVHATLVDQVEADDRGAFSDVITVPSSVPPDFDTQLSAAGQTSAKSARAPFHIAS